MEMPAQVRKAVVLLWLSLLIAFVITPFEVDLADWKEEPWWLPWALFGGGFLVAALPIVFVARRHNCARIVLLLLTLATIASMIWLWNFVESWWTVVSDVGFIALDVVALYWLFTGAGAAWFSKRRTGTF